MTTSNQKTLNLLKLRTTKKSMSFDLIYTSCWRQMSALLNIWSLSRKKNHKKRSVSENADCHCYKWGSYLYTTVGVPCFRSKEMGKRPFQGLHHSHILSFLNANNISNEYTTMYQFPQRPHGENQTHRYLQTTVPIPRTKWGKERKAKWASHTSAKKSTPKQPHCKKDYYQTGYQP